MTMELMRSRDYFGVPLHPPAEYSKVMFHKGMLEQDGCLPPNFALCNF